MFSKQSFLLISACVAMCFAASLTRNKRQGDGPGMPFELPDGVEEFIGSIKTNFLCTSPGYFADVDNNCQLFHICIRNEFPDGKTELAQYTFACGNQTIFNQFSLTCAHEYESIPCNSAPDFFYLNERIGKENEWIHQDADVEKAASYLPVRQ